MGIAGFGSGDGYGYGFGFGSGSGYGYGFGCGYGFGYGYGSGSGSGSGSGYGCGYGCGCGDGYGDGDCDGRGSGGGRGSGDGDGYGDGNGDVFATEMLAPYARDGAVVAFWRSDANGKPANGGTGHASREIGTTETVDGPLRLCTHNALHGTLQPWKWHGERLWVVALHGEVVRDVDKLGALKREIIAEIVPNPFIGKD